MTSSISDPATALPTWPDNPADISHWPEIARLWSQVGPPLRPAAEDLLPLIQGIAAWAGANGPPRALILGVTPELYRLPWPTGTHLMAIDRTRGMIDAVWPGPREAVICADWTAVPLPESSRDIVLCDGGVHLVAHPHGHLAFLSEMKRIVAPGGLCVFRLFAPTSAREEPDQVLSDFLGGAIPNLNILKLRLGMAMQESASEGVELGQVWRAIHHAARDFEQLAGRLGWPLEHLLAINSYRDSTARYHFLDPDTVCRLFCQAPGGFELVSFTTPTYLLGERCPTIVLQRRNR
ncbi:MAG: class I SAM-dependent methyltransferase [Gallionellaceae bacterium]|nr:class I SAM-dependent methyltransferase [Gallionellaceae bacterium]